MELLLHVSDRQPHWEAFKHVLVFCFCFVLFFLEIGMSFNLTIILHLVYVLYAANIGELSSIVTHFLANYLLRSFAFM